MDHKPNHRQTVSLHCDSFKRSDSFVGEDGGPGGGGRGSLKAVTNGSAAAADGAPLPRPLVPASPGSGSGSAHGRPTSPPRGSLTPSLSWGAIDNPMKLGEIQAAAEDALLAKVSDENLHKALSSSNGFEVGHCYSRGKV